MTGEVIEYHRGELSVYSNGMVLETKSQHGITCTWSGQLVNDLKSIKYTWEFDWDELMKQGVDKLHGHIIARRTFLTAAENVQIDVELTKGCESIERTIDNVNQNTGPRVAFDYYLTPTYAQKTSYDEMFAASEKTDGILVVQGKNLHVNKAFLSFHSDFFTALFSSNFKEGHLTEIPIEDVSFEDFALLLSTIYPETLFPNDSNVEKLLELADRFLMRAVIRQVEHHLVHISNLGFEKALWMADKYGMPELLAKIVRSMDTVEKAKKLEKFPQYDELSGDTKGAIFKRLLKMI